MLKNTHYIIQLIIIIIIIVKNSLKQCLTFKPQNILRICILMFIDG